MLGGMTTAIRSRYSGYRFPPEIIGHAVWLYFRFPLGLRMVEELLAERGIIVSHETSGSERASLARGSRPDPPRLPVLVTSGISMRLRSKSPG